MTDSILKNWTVVGLCQGSTIDDLFSMVDAWREIFHRLCDIVVVPCLACDLPCPIGGTSGGPFLSTEVFWKSGDAVLDAFIEGKLAALLEAPVQPLDLQVRHCIIDEVPPRVLKKSECNS